MSAVDTLRLVVTELEAAAIPFMLVGSNAAYAHGAERSTVDGWKVDLIIRKDRRFSRSEFERRKKDALMDIDLWVASAEDVVLAKLEWSSAGSSDRQFEDAVRILEVKAGQLDEAYLDRWADELGVREMLDRARASTAA